MVPPLVLGGLARTWRWCWRNKSDQVTAEQLAGFFCSAALGLAAALVTFGFLEPRDGGYRVRGVDRYIRLSEARRRGGLAARANLVPGARQKRKSLGTSPEGAKGLPGITSGSDSALSAKVEGRRSKSEEEDLPRAAPAPLQLEEVVTDPPAPVFAPSDLQALWNEQAERHGLPRWDAMAGKRKARCAARVREHPERAWWEKVMAGVYASAFLCGDPGPWRANPDWLVGPGVAESVLEGKYAGRAASGGGRGIPADIRKGTARAEDSDHLHGPPGEHEF